MNGIGLIFRSLLVDRDAMKELSESPKFNKWCLLIILLVGIIYGLFSIQHNAEYILSFESDFLRNIVVPGIFIIGGVIMVLLTRLVFSLLLWAASRGFGGPGGLGSLNRMTTVVMVPSIIAMPAFIASNFTLLGISSIIIALIWMYIISVRSLAVTQAFVSWKAYAAISVIFIFFISIYYIVIPPAS
ncbi:YIP1 family protein [Bacillus sp. FJAT-45350]|uniref:YIP1 family protein n=1 Tax=Bacillus sp. FJAT-45350 TaxID=2011014 RepID=UPI000BB91071|nr:YIP1 family protein [Bacillus sp. FJAT-45350]